MSKYVLKKRVGQSKEEADLTRLLVTLTKRLVRYRGTPGARRAGEKILKRLKC